jgi:hypothetical protein
MVQGAPYIYFSPEFLMISNECVELAWRRMLTRCALSELLISLEVLSATFSSPSHMPSQQSTWVSMLNNLRSLSLRTGINIVEPSLSNRLLAGSLDLAVDYKTAQTCSIIGEQAYVQAKGATEK